MTQPELGPERVCAWCARAVVCLAGAELAAQQAPEDWHICGHCGGVMRQSGGRLRRALAAELAEAPTGERERLAVVQMLIRALGPPQ